MKLALLLLVHVYGTLCASFGLDACDNSQCILPNCQCSQMEAPIPGNLPQFVVISFDDSATKMIDDTIYKPILSNRKNPDGCQISATMFIPHEYTDYEIVNKLWNRGFEIGSHSITKNYLDEYWKNASEKTIVEEMGGQRNIIAKYANIPRESILGARVPNFKMNGDETYKGLKEAGFQYDNTWSTPSSKRFFPYTLDYASRQDCYDGIPPASSIPGFWISPIVNWKDMENQECRNLLACSIRGNESAVFEWMKRNFKQSYDGNREPFTMLLNSAWFTRIQNGLGAVKKFLDYLATKEDVYIVSARQVTEWSKNPVNADNYTTCGDQNLKTDCNARSCQLFKNYEPRYLRVCGKCPETYPWLENA